MLCCVLLVCILCLYVCASTHWVVTENGRIQSQGDSPFHLRRPYDLIALLDQETRRTNITILDSEMHNRKDLIDRKWSGVEGAAEMEARIYSQDLYCLQAGKLLSDIDLYGSVANNGSDRIEIEFGNVDETDNYLIPDCTTFSSLPYSMCAFEHLDAMFKRSGLSIPEEMNLYQILPVESIDAFGHGVSLELQKNTTSWVYYNLAVLYWRIKGNALNAIECGRRALHYVSRQYRDVPLLTLADVLHQSQQPKDAAVLLQSAVRHAPESYLNYIALGNTYAVQYDYNRSVNCYNIALDKNPGLESIVRSKYALLCHHSLDEGLLKLHDSLQEILTDLHDYHTLQQQWLRLQERLLWEKTPVETQPFGYTTERYSLGQRCIQRISYDESQPTITCDFNDQDAAAKFQADLNLNFQKLLQNVETETKKIGEQIARSKSRRANPSSKKLNANRIDKALPKTDSNKVTNIDDNSNMPPVLHHTYPVTLSPSRNLYFDVPGWPNRAECIMWNLPIQVHDDLDLPVYLPPENKGYQVSKMLTDHIGLPTDKEHSLPWLPPLCTKSRKDAELLYLPRNLQQFTNSVLKVHPFIKQHFYDYLKNTRVEESEIGQRIVTAMQKKAGPEWVLSIIASLYWRLRSNVKNALHCLDYALQSIPSGSTDVVFISIGSILYQLGLLNEASTYAKLAFKVNFYEPSTNFLLALVHYQSNNPILAMYYMKNVLRVEPNYYNGRADELLRTWSCRLKMGTYEDLRLKINKLDKDTHSSCFSENDLCITEGFCYYTSDQCNNRLTANINLLTNDVDPISLELLAVTEELRMKVTLVNGAASLGKFYLSISLSNDAVPETLLHVQDTSGTYTLSTRICLTLRKIDWYLYQSKWQSTAARNINIKYFLKPLPTTIKGELKPHCFEPPAGVLMLDRLDKLFKKQLPDLPDEALSSWLRTMAGDEEIAISELGTKLYEAIVEHPHTWELIVAAALYWRIIGDNKQALTCLKQALVLVPNDMKDIPLISISHIYQRAQLYYGALEIASLAVENNPDYAINHFAVGNIYDAMGNLERALSAYRSTLALDSNFEPAETRIKYILCTLLFDDNGIMKDVNNME